jgi:predicted  nucleic acid-binding Zn-ribbon protein
MVTESDLDKLRTLQDIISEKIKLQRDIQEIPKLLGTQEELLTRLKKTFIEKNLEYEKLKTAESECRNLLLEAGSMREKAEKNAGLIGTTQREFEAFSNEIKYATDKEKQYRQELQQKEKNLSELDEQIKQQTGLIEQQEIELGKRRLGIEAEIKEKQKQVDDLLEREREITSGLDSEVVFKFERIIRNKMGVGIVAIKGNVCQGCHMILPTQFANQVRIGEYFIFCPNCSRILYYEESAEEEQSFFDTEDSGSLSDLEDIDEDGEEEDEDEEGEDEADDEKESIDFDE